ncbi:MAG: hypothetical protein IT200_12610 [Thermoleophilia bacterium]|nr:hypothetical protein [Thermoleophilia bacterium]
MRRSLLVAVPAVLGAVAVPALPCSIAAPVPGAPIDSDVAVAATVTRDTGPSGGMDPRTYTLRVDTILRGFEGATLAGPLKVTTTGSSAACGVEFTRGKRYLVFASRGDGGALTTSLASGDRELGRREAVTEDDLYVPDPPGLDARHSNLSSRAFVAFTAFPAYWLGGYSGVGDLRTLRADGARTIATYRQGRAAPVRVITRRVCPAASAEGIPPLTGVRRIRGVPAGFRGHGVSVFTGGVEVRITGRSPRVQLQLAGAIFAGATSAFGGELPKPSAGPVRLLAPCRG